ncbi:MAG: NAD-dependent epimerase/dehydratase family protein [Phycisphaera sp.]|nr:MAG: NAD-dependent epimerase/dehydratase family protein [Phycisphaera sp.]
MSEQTKTVAVAGATGFIGRHVVGELLSRGYGVRALVRNTSKAAQVFRDFEGKDRLTPVQAESVTAESAPRLVEGTIGCVNCIGIIREQHGQRFESLHVRVPDLLTDACKEHGAHRFIQISALGADPDGRAEYQRTKHAGEGFVRRSGLAWTIFRPSLVVGEGGEMAELMATWARGKSQPWFFMPYFTRKADGSWDLIPGETTDPVIAPIAVTDLARAVADAMENNESIGEIYNAVGMETVSWPELLEFARDNTPNAKPNIKPSGVPAPAAALAATVAGTVGMGGLLPYDAGMASMGSENSTASLDKFTKHFGFTPASFRGALKEAVHQL